MSRLLQMRICKNMGNHGIDSSLTTPVKIVGQSDLRICDSYDLIKIAKHVFCTH